MLVCQLPVDQQTALQYVLRTLGDLYAAVPAEYLAQWEKDCKADLGECPDIVRKVEEAIKHIGLRSISRFIPVEPDYYDWELQQRAFRVNAPSEMHMCKSVILENTRCTHDDISDPLYSRYYCVITQYVSPVNTQKLLHFARNLKDKQISKKNYNFRLADPGASLALTGFEKGGVCPVGMKSPIPIILSESILALNPPVMYLGAGHIDWKLGVPVQAFVAATRCLVADLD